MGESRRSVWATLIFCTFLPEHSHVILVSALGPNPSFFLFGGTFIQLGGLLGQGPGLGLGPGLDNCSLGEVLLGFKGVFYLRPFLRTLFTRDLDDCICIFSRLPSIPHPCTVMQQWENWSLKYTISYPSWKDSAENLRSDDGVCCDDCVVRPS